MSWNPGFRVAVVAFSMYGAVGCGKQAGPVNARVAVGAAKAAKAAKSQRDPIAAVKGHRFYDDQHTVGGAIGRGCGSPTWTSQRGESGSDIVECQGDWKATGQKLSVQWAVSGSGQVKVRHCVLGGDNFSPYSYECLLFPDVSKHAGIDEMQGVWQAVDVRTDGRADVGATNSRTLTIAGDHWTLTGSQAAKGTFKNSPATTPHHIDLTIHGSADAAKPAPGIYSVEQDILKLCQSSSGKDRPTTFETEPGDGRTLVVYRRAPAPPG